MSIFFIADTHFGDEAIMRYENRPFDSAKEMDEEMIRRWNSVVTDEDDVYVVGDFASGGEEEILSRLNGEKYLVKGNHDTNKNSFYRDAGFAEVYDLPVIVNDFWIVSHEPIYVNSNMPYANIFGHVHASPLFKDYSKQHFCVSVERINFTPVSLRTIFETIKNCQ